MTQARCVCFENVHTWPLSSSSEATMESAIEHFQLAKPQINVQDLVSVAP